MNRLECNCEFCGVEATVECLNADHDPIFCPFCGEKLSALDAKYDDYEDMWDTE